MTDDNNAVIRDRLVDENGRLRQECAELREHLRQIGDRMTEPELQAHYRTVEVEIFMKRSYDSMIRQARAALAKVRT